MNRVLMYLFVLLGVVALRTHNTQAAFSDTNGHTYEEAIQSVQDEGIVQGHPDGTFRPDASINRAEFTKIIVKVALPGESGANCFPDVRNQWFAPFVCTAKEEGLVGGYPDGTFKPEQHVLFAEAAKIITIANGFTPTTDLVWYKPYVDALRQRNAVPPSITTMDQKLTRGEMAAIIYALKDNTGQSENPEPDDAALERDVWSERVDAAFASKECPKVSWRKYGDLYYSGPLIDTHYHIANIPDHPPWEDGEYAGHVDPVMGVNITITDIVCTLEQEGTQKVFAFFPVYKEIQEPMLAVAKRAMEKYPNRFVPFIMPPDNDNDPKGYPTVDAKTLEKMLAVYPWLFKGYGEIGLYERKGGGAKHLPPDSKRLLDIYPVLRKHNLTVYFHLGEQHKESYEKILEENPDINFIFHGDQLVKYQSGRQNLEDIEDIIKNHPNVFYTVDELYGDEFLVNEQHTKKIFLEHLENYEELLQKDISTWQRIIEKYPDQFMWGTDRSDNVVWDHDPDIGQAHANYGRAFIARLSPAVQEKFAYKNAETIFNKLEE